jgi:hypothetical protein
MPQAQAQSSTSPKSLSLETVDLPLSVGAPSSKLFAGWRRTQAFVRKVLSFPLRSVWLEIRSLPRRTLFLWQNNLHRILLFGKMFESGPTQSLLPNKRTNARIADTQSLRANLPWTTVVDHFLFLEGWSRGYEYGSSAPSDAAPALGSGTQQMHISPSVSPASQEMIAMGGHTSEVTPVATAGVTRSDECTRQKL